MLTINIFWHAYGSIGDFSVERFSVLVFHSYTFYVLKWENWMTTNYMQKHKKRYYIYIYLYYIYIYIYLHIYNIYIYIYIYIYILISICCIVSVALLVCRLMLPCLKKQQLLFFRNWRLAAFEINVNNYRVHQMK